MELILTEHHIQQINYENMLKGDNIKSLSQWVDLVNNPKVIENCSSILVAYLPEDLFYIPINVLHKPFLKDDIKKFLYMPKHISFRIKDKYLKYCRELYNIILKYKPIIQLATDDTLHGEFLGLYFIKKYNLVNIVKNRLVPIAQTPSSLRYACGHPKKLWYHINYATAYYYRIFQKKLLHVNLTRIYTMIMHKKKFPYLFSTYLSQYLILSKINKAMHSEKRVKNNWDIQYLDAYGTKFHMMNSISGTKHSVKRLTVGLQQYPLIVSQTPKVRMRLDQPPRMLTTIEIIRLIQQYMNISGKDIIQKGLKPAYWKYHIISYPYTDNHLITINQFNILKTSLGAYIHQLKEISSREIQGSLFTEYAPRSRFVYKSKMKAQKMYQSALIPVRIVDKDEYNKMPRLIQLIEKLVITHVLFMFAKPARIKRIRITAKSQGHQFKSTDVQVRNPNWYTMIGYHPKEHVVKVENYKVNQEIQGRFAFVPKAVHVHDTIAYFVKNKHNIKTLYDKTFERYYHILDLKRCHLINIQNQKLTLTVNGKAQLSMIKSLHIKDSIMTQPILYNDYSRTTNHLRQPHRRATVIGTKLIKITKQYIDKVLYAILTQKIRLPETPPAPQKICTRQKTLLINCPHCKKSYLLYQEYHIIKHTKKHKRYYCPHCKMVLPTHIHSFPIHSSVLPFIFQGMFPPFLIRINGQVVRRKLIYKDKKIILIKCN